MGLVGQDGQTLRLADACGERHSNVTAGMCGGMLLLKQTRADLFMAGSDAHISRLEGPCTSKIGIAEINANGGCCRRRVRWWQRSASRLDLALRLNDSGQPRLRMNRARSSASSHVRASGPRRRCVYRRSSPCFFRRLPSRSSTDSSQRRRWNWAWACRSTRGRASVAGSASATPATDYSSECGLLIDDR